MICKNCGQELNGAQFCGACGTRADAAPVAPQPVEPAVPVAQTAPAAQGVGIPSSGNNSKIICIVAIALIVLSFILSFTNIYRFDFEDDFVEEVAEELEDEGYVEGDVFGMSMFFELNDDVEDLIEDEIEELSEIMGGFRTVSVILHLVAIVCAALPLLLKKAKGVVYLPTYITVILNLIWTLGWLALAGAISSEVDELALVMSFTGVLFVIANIAAFVASCMSASKIRKIKKQNV